MTPGSFKYSLNLRRSWSEKGGNTWFIGKSKVLKRPGGSKWPLLSFGKAPGIGFHWQTGYFCGGFQKCPMSGKVTFSIIKPDAVRNGHPGKILDQIIESGFRVKALKMV